VFGLVRSQVWNQIAAGKQLKDCWRSWEVSGESVWWLFCGFLINCGVGNGVAKVFENISLGGGAR
jgi:hypothetical protein